MDLDLRRLRYFLAVAERLHFRRAAEDLGLAQPALSRQVAALERELGVTLLERDKRSVALTPAGRQLAQDARALLEAADAARRRAQRAERGTRQLVVGFRAGIVPTPAIRAFSEACPDVTVELRGLEWDDQEALVRDGLVDVGFLRTPLQPAGLRLVPLYHEPRLVALPDRHRLAGAASLSTEQLADERHLMFKDPVPGGETGARLRSFEEKLEHVAAGHGVILLPLSATRFYRRPDVVYRPVLDAEPAEVWLATDPARRSKAVQAFVELARGAAPPAGAERIAAQAAAPTAPVAVV